MTEDDAPPRVRPVTWRKSGDVFFVYEKQSDRGRLGVAAKGWLVQGWRNERREYIETLVSKSTVGKYLDPETWRGAQRALMDAKAAGLVGPPISNPQLLTEALARINQLERLG